MALAGNASDEQVRTKAADMLKRMNDFERDVKDGRAAGERTASGPRPVQLDLRVVKGGEAQLKGLLLAIECLAGRFGWSSNTTARLRRCMRQNVRSCRVHHLSGEPERVDFVRQTAGQRPRARDVSARGPGQQRGRARRRRVSPSDGEPQMTIARVGLAALVSTLLAASLDGQGQDATRTFVLRPARSLTAKRCTTDGRSSSGAIESCRPALSTARTPPARR